MTDTRISYDTVAESYAEMVRPKFAREPYHRAVLRLFVELVNADGTGKVVDVGCGPGHVTAYLHDLGIEAFGVDLSRLPRGRRAPARDEWVRRPPRVGARLSPSA